MNNLYQNQFPQQGGMVYNNHIPVPKMEGLTKEEIQQVRDIAKSQLSLELTPQQLIKSKCPHRDNGRITLNENGDGTQTCEICGETFNLVDVTEAEVEMKVSNLIDILQSIKTLYLDAPMSFNQEFMPIIELLKKVPQLYRIASNNFQKYDVNLHQQMGSGYGFNMLNNIMGGGMGMMPMQGGMMPGGQMPMQGGMMPGQVPVQGMQQGGMMPGQMQGMQTMNYGQPMQGGNPFGGYGGDPTQMPNMNMNVNMGGGMVQQQTEAPQNAADNSQELTSTKAYQG